MKFFRGTSFQHDNLHYYGLQARRRLSLSNCTSSARIGKSRDVTRQLIQFASRCFRRCRRDRPSCPGGCCWRGSCAARPARAYRPPSRIKPVSVSIRFDSTSPRLPFWFIHDVTNATCASCEKISLLPSSGLPRGEIRLCVWHRAVWRPPTPDDVIFVKASWKIHSCEFGSRGERFIIPSQVDSKKKSRGDANRVTSTCCFDETN